MSPDRILQDGSRVRVKTDGSLQIGGADGQIDFTFRVIGRRFDANTRVTDRGTILQLSSEIGPVPYSAEGVGTRRAALSIVEASQMLGESRLVIGRNRWIYFIAKAQLPNDWKPRDAIVASTRLVLQMKPHLKMLAEVLPTAKARRH